MQNVGRRKMKLKLKEDKKYIPRNKSRIMFLKFKKNKMAIVGLIIILVLIFTGLFADFIAPQSYREQNLSIKNQAPSSNFWFGTCLLYTSPSPRDRQRSRMPSSA